MAPRPTRKSPGSTTPQPPPRPDLPVQARHPPPPGLPATARRPAAVVGRVAELMGGKVVAGSTVVSDGWSGYATLTDVKHDPKVVGDAPAHLVLPWIHRVFANAKRWGLGVYHGLRRKHR